MLECVDVVHLVHRALKSFRILYMPDPAVSKRVPLQDQLPKRLLDRRYDLHEHLSDSGHIMVIDVDRHYCNQFPLSAGFARTGSNAVDGSPQY